LCNTARYIIIFVVVVVVPLDLLGSSPIRSGAGIAVFGDDWLPTPRRSALPAATLQKNGYDTRM